MLLLLCCILHRNKMGRPQFPVNQCLRKNQHFKKFSLAVASFHLKYGIFVSPHSKFIATVEDSKKITGNFKSSASFDSSMLQDSTFFSFFFFFSRCRQYILCEFTSSRPDTYSLHCSPSIMYLAIAHTQPWKWERHCVSANKCKLGN